MSDSLPKPGSLWRHYKGGGYRVVTTTTDEVTMGTVVVYESLKDGVRWARPIENWNDVVDGVRRFAPIDFTSKYHEIVKETSVDNWDGEGAKAIHAASWGCQILELYTMIHSTVPDLPEPHPSASGDGTLYLRWSKDDACVDVDIEPDGTLSCVCRKGTEVKDVDASHWRNIAVALQQTFK